MVCFGIFWWAPGVDLSHEPIYDIRYTRRLLGDIELEMIDPLYAEMKDRPMMEKRIPELFLKAYQIDPVVHVEIQRAFQNYVDNAVSKTINLPASATPETILTIYQEAYRLGLKGTTIFRDKSRAAQVLSCSSQQIC